MLYDVIVDGKTYHVKKSSYTLRDVRGVEINNTDYYDIDDFYNYLVYALGGRIIGKVSCIISEKIRGYKSEKPLDITLMDRELLVPFLIPLYENIYNKCCKYNIAMKGFICCKEGVYVIDEQNNAHLVLFPNIELKDVVVKLSLMTLKG